MTKQTENVIYACIIAVVVLALFAMICYCAKQDMKVNIETQRLIAGKCGA